MTGEDLKSIMVNIYLGLEDIHQHMQPHLNLIPSNIMIDEKGRAKISNSGYTLDEYKSNIDHYFSSIRKAKKRTRLVSIEFDDPRSELLMGANIKEKLKLPEFFKFISPECLDSSFPMNIFNHYTSMQRIDSKNIALGGGADSPVSKGNVSLAHQLHAIQAETISKLNLNCVDVWAFGMIALFLFFPSVYMSLNSNRIRRSVEEIKWSMLAQRLNPECLEFKAVRLIEKCLNIDFTRRITMKDIKLHSLFEGVKFNDVLFTHR